MTLKRLIARVLTLCVICSALASPAFAIDTSKHFDFAISVNGETSATAHVGDTITVRVLLSQKGAENMTLYALNDRVIFNSDFFELVPDSLKSDICFVTSEKLTGAWEGSIAITSGALASKLDGDMWSSPTVFATFELKVITPGSSVIQHRNSDMSNSTAMDIYENSAADATVSVRNFPYTDTPRGEWYRQAVEYAADERLIDGHSATLFFPNSPATRATLVTALYRLEGSPQSEQKAIFSDVENGTELAAAVNWANSNGIVTGDRGKFNPENKITREGIATLFYNYAMFKKTDTTANNDLSAFTDSTQISAWAKPGLSWAVTHNIFVGDNGKINPQGTSTRAGIAQILYNLTHK
jgi:hypothetical protein